MENINTLLEKYNNFKDAQIRSIVQTTDSSKTLTLVTQDDDGEDVDTIKIEFAKIKESRILEGSVLPFLDMMSGITLIKEHEQYGFAVGSGTSMLHVHSAPMYIVSSEMTIQQGL